MAIPSTACAARAAWSSRRTTLPRQRLRAGSGAHCGSPQECAPEPRVVCTLRYGSKRVPDRALAGGCAPSDPPELPVFRALIPRYATAGEAAYRCPGHRDSDGFEHQPVILVDEFLTKRGAMKSLANRIMEYAEASPEATPICPSALLHLGKRGAVNQALSRLARSGQLLRIYQGVYMRPIETRFGRCAPSVDKSLRSLLSDGARPSFRTEAARPTGLA